MSNRYLEVAAGAVNGLQNNPNVVGVAVYSVDGSKAFMEFTVTPGGGHTEYDAAGARAARVADSAFWNGTVDLGGA